MPLWLFAFLAALALISSLGVILQRNPVHCLLSLALTLLDIGVLFMGLGAETVGFLQIIIYVGAIMVLFLFVIWLLNVQAEYVRGHLGIKLARRAGSGGVISGAVCLDLSRAGVIDGDHDARELWIDRKSCPATFFKLSDRIRSDFGLAARNRGRRDRPCAANSAISGSAGTRSRGGESQERGGMTPLGYFLALSAAIFAIGVTGVMIRRNLIVMFMSIELMLNAVNLAFITLGRRIGSMDGQVIVFFAMTVAAAEAAIGLGIMISVFRNRATVNADELNLMRW